MIFEQLISDAKQVSPQKNMIYQLADFKKTFAKSQKLIDKEFSKLGLHNYAKKYSDLAYKHLTEALSSLDLKHSYDLEKLLICIKENVIPFLKRDLLFQLNENKFQPSKYVNNLMTMETDYVTTPPNLKQIVNSCIEYYKNEILNDRKDNSVMELSNKINKNKKILDTYDALHAKFSNPYAQARDKSADEKIEMIDIEYDIEDLKEKLQKAKEELTSTSKIQKQLNEQQKKYDEYVERQKKYNKVIKFNSDKLDEIIDENKIISQDQENLISQQRTIIYRKALNKKMYRLMKQFSNKLKFYQTLSISNE